MKIIKTNESFFVEKIFNWVKTMILYPLFKNFVYLWRFLHVGRLPDMIIIQFLYHFFLDFSKISRYFQLTDNLKLYKNLKFIRLNKYKSQSLM